MTRIKRRIIASYVPKNRRTRRSERVPEPVQPTPEALLPRAEALGIDIKLTVDRMTGRLAWDNSHDLTMAVDALAPGRRG